MAEFNKTVTVIIPSKRSDAIERCLVSLEKQTYPSQLMEIIVVSPEKRLNKSDSGINIKNVIDLGLNQAEARNIAEKYASGDILAFCDDDCVAPINWIEKGAKHFQENNVATVGGPSTPPFATVSFREQISGSLMVSFLGTGSHSKAYIQGSKTEIDNAAPVSFVCANMFVDRSKFEEVGGFDNVVPQEEDRLNTKLANKGYRLIYDPNCSNTHYQRPWGFKSIRNIFWLMAGQGSLTMDRLSPSSKFYLIPPLFAIGVVVSPAFLLIPTLATVVALIALVYVGVVLTETCRQLLKLKIAPTQKAKFFFVFPIAVFIHHFTSGAGFLLGFSRKLFTKLLARLRKVKGR